MNNERDSDIFIKEEVIEDLSMECKKENEFQGCECEDLLKQELVIKEECIGDCVNIVREEPLNAVLVDKSHLYENDIKDEDEDETNAVSRPDKHKIPAGGGSAYGKRQGQFICHHCGFSTHTRYLAKRHIKRHVEGNAVAGQAKYESEVMKETVKHRLDKEYHCHVYDYKDHQMQHFNEHNQTPKQNHSEELFACQLCNFQFPNKKRLRSHMLTDLEGKPHSRKVCGYRTTKKAYFKRHSLTHSRENLYSCDACDYKSARKETLKEHVLTHSGEKPYSCNLRNFRSNHSNSLKMHYMSKHSGEKPYRCNVCDYRAIRKANLKNHMLTHSREKPYSCDVCNYRATLKKTLKIHMMKHSGEKPYSCDVCNYRATQKTTLKIHMKTHSGEKPYSCDVCYYRAIRKVTLKRHMLTHSEEKQFACNLSKYTTIQNAHLRKEFVRSEMSYFCDVCNYRATNRESLKIHLLTHSLEKPYFCNFCDYWVRVWNLMKMHCMVAHNVELQRGVRGGKSESLELPLTEELWSCDVCDFQAPRWATLHEHYLFIHDTYLPHGATPRTEKIVRPSSSTEIVLNRVGKTVAEFSNQSNDFKKALPDAVVVFSCPDLNSETLQHTPTDPSSFSDHNYCLKPSSLRII